MGTYSGRFFNEKMIICSYCKVYWNLFENRHKRYIRGRIDEIKALKIKYKPVPKKISKNFQSSLEFLLYEEPEEWVVHKFLVTHFSRFRPEKPKRVSKKRSATRSMEKSSKRPKLSIEPANQFSKESPSITPAISPSTSETISIISISSLHRSESDCIELMENPSPKIETISDWKFISQTDTNTGTSYR